MDLGSIIGSLLPLIPVVVIVVLFFNSLWGPRARRQLFALVGRFPAALVAVLSPDRVRTRREAVVEQQLSYLGDPWQATPWRFWWLQGAGLVVGALLGIGLALWMGEGLSSIPVTLPGAAAPVHFAGNSAQPNATPVPGATTPETPATQPATPAPSGFVLTVAIVLGGALGMIGWFYPRQALSRKVEQRKQRLLLQLADLLELMAITMRAGAEFDQALETATGMMYNRYDRKPELYPLGVELAQALFERNVGVSRADFMESLGLRATMRTERRENEFTDIAVTLWDELTQAVSLSQEVGSSLKDTLPEIVERVRSGRLKGAEQAAAGARVSIIYPQTLLVLALMLTLLASVGLFIGNLFSQ